MYNIGDKFELKDPTIRSRMQLRSEIHDHMESWRPGSHRKIRDFFAELRAMPPSCEHATPAPGRRDTPATSWRK